MVLSVNEDIKDYKKMQNLDKKELVDIIKNKDKEIENLLENINEMFNTLQKVNLEEYEDLLLDTDILINILRRDNLLTDELEKEIDYIMKWHNSLKDYNLEEIDDIIADYEDNIDNIIYENDDITLEYIDKIDEENLPF